MKMTTKCIATLSAVMIGLLVGAGGLLADTDNYSENFEGFTVGNPISGETDWTATETNSVIASTNYTASYTGGNYPLDYDHAANTQVLNVQNGVTNTIVEGGSAQSNWLDVVVNPVYADDPPDIPALGTVAAVYFNTNGQPVVMHTPTNTAYAEWVTITNTTVGEDEWIRLTIVADFKTVLFPPAANPTRLYKVYINGVALSDDVAYLGANRSLGTGPGGIWFGTRRANAETSPFTNVMVKGTGYIDDLVVTNDLQLTPPDPPAATYIETLPSVSELTEGDTLGDANLTGGSVTNGGGTTVTGTFDFMDPAVVPPVGTNGYYVLFTPDDSGSYLTSSGEVQVVVVEAGGPPPSWLTDTGVDQADLDNDLRGDGLTARQAWVASADPTNSVFKFEVTAMRRENGSNLVEWVSVYVDTNLPPFGIWARTNLMDTTYDLIDTYPRVEGATPATPVTNIWSEDAPAYPVFYRVVATNAPSGP